MFDPLPLIKRRFWGAVVLLETTSLPGFPLKRKVILFLKMAAIPCSFLPPTSTRADRKNPFHLESFSSLFKVPGQL